MNALFEFIEYVATTGDPIGIGICAVTVVALVILLAYLVNKESGRPLDD